MTDAQWARLEALILSAKPSGRPRETDMRTALDALFYVLRTGYPPRYLSGAPFPPRTTVYNISCQFHRAGVWEQIWAEMLMALRNGCGR